jgi:hypothetical protein
VSTKDGKPDVHLYVPDKSFRLGVKSPYWMEVRILGGDGKPAKGLPGQDGYFEIMLPKAFFEGQPKSIKLEWVDFLRN